MNTSEELGVIDVDDIWPIEDDLDEEMLLNLPDARDFDLVPSPRTVPKAKPAKAYDILFIILFSIFIF